MTFHRCIQLSAFRAEWQIQLVIERENLEVIAMRPRGRTGAAVTRFAEVICSLHSFRRAAFRNPVGLGRIFQTVQCVNNPLGASGSSTTRARLFASEGISAICNGGLYSRRHT